MAWTSGTASDYLDLLTRSPWLFVTEQMLPANERWQVMRWVPGPPAELVLQGVHWPGPDEIYVAIQTETSPDWQLETAGYVTYNPGVAFDAQYNSSQTLLDPCRRCRTGSSPTVVASSWWPNRHLLRKCASRAVPHPMRRRPNIRIPWWWVVRTTVRRAGATPTLQPSAAHGGLFRAYWSPTGTWNSSPVFLAGTWGSNQREAPDGSYPLLPFVIWGLGELDGMYSVPGYGNSVENIITANGVDHPRGAGRVSHRVLRPLGTETGIDHGIPTGITTSPNDLPDKIRLFATTCFGYTQLMYQGRFGLLPSAPAACGHRTVPSICTLEQRHGIAACGLTAFSSGLALRLTKPRIGWPDLGQPSPGSARILPVRRDG